MNLSTLTALKNWLEISTSNDDVLLTSLLSQMSRAVLDYIQRPDFTRSTFTELRDGIGNNRLLLRNWPVISISSLIIGKATIPAASSFGQSGYTLSTWDGASPGIPQTITLCGYEFWRGSNNVQIIYDAGYCVLNEAQTVPGTPYAVTVNQRLGNWSQDDGVYYASTGTKLTAVASMPAVGQYTVSGGVYTFNSADASSNLLFNYSYIPSPLEQATLEWIGERYRYKKRIGQKSQSLGGQETASYQLTLPQHIDMMCAPYKKWMPI